MKFSQLLFCLLPIFTQAQTEKSLLWKVSKKGSENVSYLFGSIHSNDSTLNTWNDTWWNAFNSCHTMAGEVNFTDQTELMASLQNSMMKDKTLQDLYTEEEFSRIQKFLASKLDPMSLKVVGKMKPFYIMASMMEMPKEEGPYTEVMDFRLQTVARSKNMKVIGLESTTEQASSIDVVSIEDQAKMLLEYVDAESAPGKDATTGQNELQIELEKMEKFYLEQNLDSLADVQSTVDIPPAMMESLVDNRNDRFIKKLLPHLEDANVFCAVGALHLPGKNGMIAQLRKLGYTVEPVYFQFVE